MLEVQQGSALIPAIIICLFDIRNPKRNTLEDDVCADDVVTCAPGLGKSEKEL